MTAPDPLLDFRNFLFLVWDHLNLPAPTPVQYDIASFLQNGPKRSLIEAFRGVGKSWVTSAFVCWLLYRDPQTKILVLSASKNRADDFTTFTMRLILEMDALAHLRPRSDQRNSKIAFDVAPARASHAPSVKSLGITSQIAGSRANVIIADDIEVPNNSDTALKREKLAEQIKEFDAVLSPGGRIIYLGTPQSEQSIYNLLPERGYRARVWPALYPSEDQLAKYGLKLAPKIAEELAEDIHETLPGSPTDPSRFNAEDLEERRLSYGRSGFALQFMLDTSLSDEDRYPLKLSDLIVLGLDRTQGPAEVAWSCDPERIVDEIPSHGLPGDRLYRPASTSDKFKDWEGAMMFVDPSGRGKDETAWAILKSLHGRLFLSKMGSSRLGYAQETLRAILKDAKDYGVNIIQVEPNMGDGMFTQLLRAQAQALYEVTIEDSPWAKGQKEARIIDTLEPILNQHRLVVCPTVLEWDHKSTEGLPQDDVLATRLTYQLTRITRARGALRHDDRLDALAGAVAYWLDQMDINSQKAEKTHNDDLLEQELLKFIEATEQGSGVLRKGNRWF